MIMKEYIQLWEKLRTEINANRHTISSIELCKKLLEWGENFKNSKNPQAKDLYLVYLDYYASLDLNLYRFRKVWYSLEELIERQILQRYTGSFKSLVPRCSDLLNEMIVFKSSREYKLVGFDNLRVFTTKDYGKLYFCCDSCSYVEDIKGVRISELPSRLLPAAPEQIDKNFIDACSL